MQLCNRINDNKRIINLCRSSLILTTHVIVIYLTYLSKVWHVNNRLQTARLSNTAYHGLLPLM